MRNYSIFRKVLRVNAPEESSLREGAIKVATCVVATDEQAAVVAYLAGRPDVDQSYYACQE